MNLSILIAEDDHMLGDLWRTTFQRAGYAVDIVDDGIKAIDWLHGGLPDVLILDYNMPGANGLDVLRELIHLDPDNRVLAVMITANHTIQQAPENERIDMFLQKPMGFKEMLTLVDRLASTR
jgi:DNA-binding response OmpR family regulator